MTDDRVREKIRERLHAGILPHSVPGATRFAPDGASPPPDEVFVGRSNQPCSACDGYGAYITYRYPGRTVQFHLHCYRLWEAEPSHQIRWPTGPGTLFRREGIRTSDPSNVSAKLKRPVLREN